MADLIDVNVWIGLVLENHVHNASARIWMQSVPQAGAAFCRITQLSFLRLLTNRKMMGPDVFSQDDAWKLYDITRSDSRTAFVEEPPGIEPVFRSLTRSKKPEIETWPDAYLAAFAILLQTRLVTFDKGFERYPGLNLLLLK